MTDTTKANIKILFALTRLHFTGDFYSSFISPLYPLFIQKMNLSLHPLIRPMHMLQPEVGVTSIFGYGDFGLILVKFRRIQETP